ncbi:MAG: mannose-6-phosphate isomerase [Salinivirgaceae bacterium]|nr:mannose-6-phosphate isomerase [Salinivirgaceae bacterium]MDD4746638.1 mannose-6-phosphate isomerase [Salinivirgaceae bacterium]MDY0279774.1 mannose-6-phosphate isomerase [Salinivirgaceae bacterium]
MNQLYPLKFEPIYKPKIWGGDRLRKFLNKNNVPEKCGESWEISAVDGNVSVVSNGFLAGNNLQELIEIYMGDLVGDPVFEEFGDMFPLLIKFIDANHDLSVQVHPNDEMAYENHSSYGKTEMWYILEAENGAKNITGLKANTKQGDIVRHLAEKNLEEILVTESAQKGDVFFIPAGRVHATGKGILFAEIQQTSDITYRLYDYNRPDESGNLRELHIESALEAIDYEIDTLSKVPYRSEINTLNKLVDCQYFTVHIFPIEGKVERILEHLNSFVVYMCVSGSCLIKHNVEKSPETLRKGETILIPAIMHELHIESMEENTILLEVYINEKKK